LVAEAIAASLHESYPKFNMNYLRSLALQYKGRQEELHKYIQLKLEVSIDTQDLDPDYQQNSNDDGKFLQLRQDLETYIRELGRAGVEELERLVLEDCPGCYRPQILSDKDDRLFHCNDGCKLTYCRVCRSSSHEPLSCLEYSSGDRSYSVVKTRTQYLSDVETGWIEEETGEEFQMVEMEFLRMMRGMGKEVEVLDIDIVENKMLEAKFKSKRAEFGSKGLEDVPVLLFNAVNDSNIEEVLKNNYPLVLSPTGIQFTDTPNLIISEERNLVVMALVLEGSVKGVSVLDRKAVFVPDVDQILPKYVVRFIKKSNNSLNRSKELKLKILKPQSSLKEVTVDESFLKPFRKAQEIELITDNSFGLELPVLKPRNAKEIADAEDMLGCPKPNLGHASFLSQLEEVTLDEEVYDEPELSDENDLPPGGGY